MAYTKIINKTYDLVEEIKESKIYQEMLFLDEIIKNKYKEELKNYQETFEKFDEVYCTGGTYHPDFKEVSQKYKKAKEILFNKDEVKKYFINEAKLNEILKELSKEIIDSVSNYEELKGGVCSWI